MCLQELPIPVEIRTESIKSIRNEIGNEIDFQFTVCAQDDLLQ